MRISAIYYFFLPITMFSAGFPGSSRGKEPTCQCRRCKRHSFNPQVRKTPWRKAWQPTPVFLSGEAHGQRSLVGCSPWALIELDTTEATLHACMRAHVFSSSCVLFDHLNVSIMREGTVSITFNAEFPEPKISAWHRVISQ